MKWGLGVFCKTKELSLCLIQVIELINQAHLMTKDAQKIAHLKHVQELIVHKDPTLLDNFLDVSIKSSIFFPQM